MNRAKQTKEKSLPCEVIDFDEALIDACTADERAELMTEAKIVAQVFANDGSVDELEEMAQSLSTGGRDTEMERAHARKLAAALKRLAREPWN